VSWIANYNKITGVAGAFENLAIGTWVKKVTDDDTYYNQIIARNGTSFSNATEITLGNAYSGTTSTSAGISFDQENGVGGGLFLSDADDIVVLEGDSVRVDDSLFISTVYNSNWFSTNNSGTFNIDSYGFNPLDYRPFLRVSNTAGSAETGRLMSIPNTDFYIRESDAKKMSAIKQIAHITIDDYNPERRVVYLTPGDRSYKWNQTNGTKMVGLGKLGFDSNIVTGIDGYLYYTGLLRTVQRVIDGFEPDAVSYPGRKAIGGIIEILPPLPRNITVALDTTTENGVNLSEITNEIKSAVINYVRGLTVGEDVIMSSIIVKVKSISGVAAVTFITPGPAVERIAISNDEKAFISADAISIA
jgi:hypothetical protein